jgi:hypothetical protein
MTKQELEKQIQEAIEEVERSGIDGTLASYESAVSALEYLKSELKRLFN